MYTGQERLGLWRWAARRRPMRCNQMWMITPMGRTVKRPLPGAFFGLLCLAGVSLLAACGEPSAPAPLPTHTPFPTSIPTPPPTDTPPPTSTPAPTAVPWATQAAAPSPTATIPPRTAPALVPTSTPTLSSMVEQVTAGIVQIVTSSGTGSGFIIDEEGLVVTNAHVVEGFETVDVRLASGQSYQAEVLGVDAATDLALLDLRGVIEFEPVALGDSDTVSVGEEVIAMGYPLGGNDILLGSASVTSGILSAKRTSRLGIDLLQTDAAVNPGSSGGPLFDRDGQVVGVNTLKVFESKDGRPVEGIGLAVAINEVRDRLDLLARGGDVIPPNPTQGTADHAPTTAPGVSFVSVSAGGLHTCSLTSDGSAVCWGSNYDGKSTPPRGSFTSVSAGGRHICGVKAEDSAVCWGSDDNGQSTPPPGSFLSVDVGDFHSCGIKSDNSVECWGSNVDLDGIPRGQSTPPGGSFTSVSAGSFHTCGIKTDGSAVCWGSNVDIDGIPRGQSTPLNGSFASISAGSFHTCGLKTDGAIACWGDDSGGQSTPPAGSFTSINTGSGHTCGVKTDGVVTCWGYNEYGQATSPPVRSFRSVLD